MSSAFSLVLGWSLFPYVIAVVMPTWRWLLGCTLLIGGPLAYLWIDHWIASQQIGYKEGPGGAIGIILFMVVTCGFASGVAVRIVSLFAWARGYRKGSFWISACGFAVPLAIFLAPSALDQWRKRPAPESCVTEGFRAGIDGVQLNVPIAPLFTIYTGPSSARDAFYMFNVAMVRDLCSRTSNGTQPVRATNLGMRFDSLGWQNEAVCAKSPSRWNERFCTAMPAIRRGKIDETGFPINAYVFVPNQVRLGEFLGSASSYDDSTGARPARPGEYFVKSKAQTPDGKPLTFACHAQSDSSQWCTASYAWSGGAHLHYAFRASEGQVEQKGRDVDATIRTFIEMLRDTRSQ